MRMTPAFRVVAIVLALALGGVAVYTYTISTKSERAYVFIEDTPQYTFIESTEALKPISVPVNRDFLAITNPSQIVGQYTNQQVYAGQLVQPGLLMAQLPDGRRQFEYGLLPIDVGGYPVAISSDVAAVFRPDDLVDILVIIDQDGLPGDDDMIIPLFQKVRALEVVGADDSQSGTLVVGLNYQQIGVYEGLKAMEGVSFTAAINQPANADYPALYPSQLYPDLNDPIIRNLFAAPTPTPVPPVTEAEADGNEGDGGN